MPNIVVAYIKEDKVAPYLEALAAVGVAESDIFRATPRRTATVDLHELLARADGLLLTGGADLQPCLYGEARRRDANLDRPAPDRDQLEWDLLCEARAHRTPVFGICRGHQMVNVFLGGSLYQDIELQTGRSGHDNFIDRGFALDHLAHDIVATGIDHPLAARTGKFGHPAVNSRHHQAVKVPGKGLVTVAQALDGTIEATVAGEPGWWITSVQWHPENLVDHPFHRALFEDFLTAAGEFALHRSTQIAEGAVR
ncbi:MAG: type 1 glutamine amidotransferase [Thermoanaerobaculia bacterium]|nr:type 1 glutamine amidotransferase [Thermoanaerobaculia bacterium]MBP9823430.1 type 1 glutamine amidotransferase [Thermoanaerobaculia bacterium]